PSPFALRGGPPNGASPPIGEGCNPCTAGGRRPAASRDSVAFCGALAPITRPGGYSACTDQGCSTGGFRAAFSTSREVDDMRRTYDLLRTVLRPQRPRARGRRWGIFVLGSIVVASIAWSARRYELPVELPIQLPVQLPALDLAALLSPAAKHVHRPAVPSVDGLIERAERVDRLWREVEHYYEQEIAPIERVLMRYRADPELA